MIKNIMTIDIEDFFFAHNLEGIINRDEWVNLNFSFIQNVQKILHLLKKNNTEATFFVLGWIADKYPDLIAQIESEGHEIASHGYSHQLVNKMNKESFDYDLKRSISAIRKIIKGDIIGYRAPSFTVNEETIWAIDILEKNGLLYDSSVFPISFHPVYGYKSSPISIYNISARIKEIPISCLEIFKFRIPCTGGAYFRILPYYISKYLFSLQNKKKQPVVFYFHPWEIDPNQPRYKLPYFKRIRHYYSLSKNIRKLEALLIDFSFTSIRSYLCLTKQS